MRAQVATLGPSWAEHKLEGTSWIMIGWLQITERNKVNIREDFPSRTSSSCILRDEL